MSKDAIPTTAPADMALCRSWIGHYFTDATRLPISFVLNGKPITGIPAAWQPSTEQRRIDANLTETIFAGTDPDSGLHLRVESLLYHDYPVKLAFHHTLLGWIPYFKEVTFSLVCKMLNYGAAQYICSVTMAMP